MTWMMDTNGERSASLTFATWAVIVMLLWVVGAVVAGFLGKTVPLDATVIGAMLTPTLGTYVARRYTGAKFPDTSTPGTTVQTQTTTTATVKSADTDVPEVPDPVEPAPARKAKK